MSDLDSNYQPINVESKLIKPRDAIINLIIEDFIKKGQKCPILLIELKL